MAKAFYNEIDPYAAQWLRNLIAAGHIAPGDVDERSIEDIRPDELAGYTQCHFFAGIGVWSYALRLAGWPDDEPVWTGSCPCQPFSTAGKGAGFADERHLWPAFYHLIRECRPPVIFGEQVASSHAAPWLDLVQDDLEILDYAFGAVAFPAASVGAPHIRDRMYWVANDNGPRLEGHGRSLGQHVPEGRETERRYGPASGVAGGVADDDGAGRLAGQRHDPATGHGNPATAARIDGDAGPTNGFWRAADWLYCRDGKWRPVEPGTFPLAHGTTVRVGRLRAYGNAIVAPQCAEFIRAYREL